ncbi:FtsH protease activity modulator HflK [Alienimonas chondri]|uniref:Protein HflK n=1 Tax=Alienimonas chondri TaxID=2681879 RepID=A0ABX1VCV3_9PLAN|nr:FtsH protease activity modulator HflK [Alienimonas chondri]NNJ24871.1 Modulator of FtsH protease HflK [Alienimonas chondri]
MPTDPFGRPTRRPPDEIDLTRFVKPTLIGLAALFLLLAAVQCVYTVEPNERAVVLRFGEFSKIASSGLHFRVPFADRVEIVSVEEHELNLPEGVRLNGMAGVASSDDLMLTGELYAADVQWTLQWKVNEAEADKYLFAFDRAGSPDEFGRIIATVSQTVMNRLVGDYSIDEVLTSERGEIEAAAEIGTQAILDGYECGVTITDLQLQTVTPPAEVKSAFDDVVASIQDQGKFESEANRERARKLNESKAEADKLVREAEGYADREKAEVDGEIVALRARYEAYRAAPDVTRQRLYLEAMQEVLSGVSSKTILDSDLESLLPLLNLQNGAN